MKPTLWTAKGFTLVEILVVATIFAVIASGMASSFLAGMRLWARARQQDRVQTDALFALEVMGGELRQSVDLPPIRFSGSAREISFPAALGDAVVKVTYEYDPVEKRLRRRQVSLQDVVEENLAPDEKERTLATSVDEVLIEFAAFDQTKEEKHFEWKEAWDEKDGIPSAVRLTMTVKHDTLTKTIFIPIA